ncbi:MAG: enoyl-CoA hydratase [Acidiferrobacterales bacterium]
MPSGYVQIEQQSRPQGVVYTLTASRPERLNILDSVALQDLEIALANIASDEQARVVVLAGAGPKAWIAGADVREMQKLERPSAIEFVRRLHRVFNAVRELPVPVLAQITGYCLGAGLELAASCDLRVASDDSRFGMPEVQVGIPSVVEAALLPRLIGSGRARDLVLTGRLLNAGEALAWGLVEAVATRDGLHALVEERVDYILNAGPQAIRLQKALCRQWEELPLSEAVQRGIEAFGRAYEGDEPRTYMERFLTRGEQE